jgi:hypothetical protein
MRVTVTVGSHSNVALGGSATPLAPMGGNDDELVALERELAGIEIADIGAQRAQVAAREDVRLELLLAARTKCRPRSPLCATNEQKKRRTNCRVAHPANFRSKRYSRRDRSRALMHVSYLPFAASVGLRQ